MVERQRNKIRGNSDGLIYLVSQLRGLTAAVS